MKRLFVLLRLVAGLGFFVTLSTSPFAVRVAEAQDCYSGSGSAYCRSGDDWCWDTDDGFVGNENGDLDNWSSCNPCNCGYTE